MPSNEEMARHLLACYDTIYMVLGESAPTLSADAYVVRTYEMGRSFGALALEMRDFTEATHVVPIAAPDGREVALVVIVEGGRRPLAAQSGADDLTGVAPLLHRHRRDAGHDAHDTVSAAHAHHVAEREHLRVARQRQVGLHRQAPGAVQIGAGEIAEPLREAGGGDARRPTTVRVGTSRVHRSGPRSSPRRHRRRRPCGRASG